MEEVQFPKLNLPPFDIRIKESKDGHLTVWDIIRKKHIVLTPEEWVRQHFIHLLIDHLEYPPSLFKIEKEHYLNKLKKRCDIEVTQRDISKTFLLVECKAPEVKLNEKTLKQLATYNSTLSASYIAISNGIKHYIWKHDPITNSYNSINKFPVYPIG